jgi:SUN family beta-glucosidase
MPCNTPPFQYGADNVVVRYLGGNGWLNQQVATDQNYRNEKGCGGYGDAYCQYVCPGTHVPTQWAKFYPDNGISLGGLLCKNNLLYRPNQDFDTLCMPSSGVMTVTVRNTLDEPVAICKTNYPGRSPSLFIVIVDNTNHSL